MSTIPLDRTPRRRRRGSLFSDEPSSAEFDVHTSTTPCRRRKPSLFETTLSKEWRRRNSYESDRNKRRKDLFPHIAKPAHSKFPWAKIFLGLLIYAFLAFAARASSEPEPLVGQILFLATVYIFYMVWYHIWCFLIWFSHVIALMVKAFCALLITTGLFGIVVLMVASTSR